MKHTPTIKMMLIRSTIALLLALMSLASFGATPVAANTITVTTIADENGENSSKCSLREAIYAANYNTAYGGCSAGVLPAHWPDTIVLSSGTYKLTRNDDLDIMSNLIIKGAGMYDTVINGNAGARVLYIHSRNTVTIDSLKITNGKANNGGGIYNRGTLTVQNSIIGGYNTAAYKGGGIYNYKGTLTVQNSIIGDNTASTYGGGIYNNDGSVTVQNSTIDSNKTNNWSGGGIYQDHGTLTVQNSTISGNTATYNGGGLFNYRGTVTVQNSTISGNTADHHGGYGGGIYVLGTLTVQNSTISGNTAEDDKGGGIFISDGTLTLKNSIIANSTGSDCHNYSSTVTDNGHNLVEDGSCINVGSNGSVKGDPKLGSLRHNGGPTKTHLPQSGSKVIDAGTFAGSSDDQRGASRPQNGDNTGGAAYDIGAVEVLSNNYIYQVTTTVDEDGANGAACSLREAIKAANTDQAWGGCLPGHGDDTINLPADTYKLTRNIQLNITSNLTLKGAGESRTVIDGNAGARVLHIASGNTVTIDSLTIRNGKANTGGGIYNDQSTLTVQNSTISGNTATYVGGGIYNLYGTLTVDDSTISGNTATDDGGGIYIGYSGNLTVDGSTIRGNTADGNGGGICNQGHTWTVDDSTIRGNTAKGSGGGIYSSVNLTVDASTISDNTATYNGGGICVLGTLTVQNSSVINGNEANAGGGISRHGRGSMTIDQSTISDNTAKNNGGGIYNGPHGTVTVDRSTLSGNTATNGGGIHNKGTLMVQNSSTVSGNTATDNGGGIYNAYQGTLTVDASTISGNTADDKGGGIYQNSSNTLTVDASTISGNTANYGGGIYQYKGTLTVDASTISGNTASNSGGGIYQNSSNTLTVDASTISGNTATNGGGIYHSRGTLRVKNSSTIRDNTATNDGGGIYNNNTLIVDASTISGNTADDQGGGIYNNKTLIVDASTISGNTATDGGGIYRFGGGTVTVDASTISDNTAHDQGGGLYNEQGTLTVDQSTFNSNSATNGGGIYNADTLTVTNSTLSANAAASDGGGLYNSGAMQLVFVTLAYNHSTPGGAANVHNTGTATAFAVLIVEPIAGTNCNTNPDLTSAAHLTSAGYNRISDDTCLDGTVPDEENVVDAQIFPLDDSGGPTLVHPLVPEVNGQINPALDIVPAPQCSAYTNVDQRGQLRPKTIFEHNQCDAGAFELFVSNRFVCGPPLVASTSPARCQYTSIAAALNAAVAGDTLVISGVIIETVTVNKSVTLRGPRLRDITPGTHMGIVQATATPPDGDEAPGSVFTIPSGVVVTLQDLNIRHGDAYLGGGVNNQGTLTVQNCTFSRNSAYEGGGIYNSGGILTVQNSTFSENTSADFGGGIYNSGGTLTVQDSTLSDNAAATDGGAIYNGLGGTLTLAHSILAHSTLLRANAYECVGGNAVTDAGHNLVTDGSCITVGAHGNIDGDPQLGPLRDNGGSTLTRDLGADSPAIEAGPPVTDCVTTADQRGKARPFDSPGGGGPRCDIGALEYGPRTLTVCAGCTPDPANLLFDDLQTALYQTMAGDTLALRAGVYTGRFIIYKDVTLQHAGLDISQRDPRDPVDARAILQASADSLAEQYEALTATRTELGTAILTVQAYAYPGDSVQASSDVSVTLQDLTLRHGLSRRGGAIYNVGRLHLLRTTVAENAAVNALQADGTLAEAAQGGGIYNAGTLTLERSTLSGNHSESYGGGLYNQGRDAQSLARLNLRASTLADNQIGRIYETYMLVIDRDVMAGSIVRFTNPIAAAVSGDHLRFHNQTPVEIELLIQPADACNQSRITLARNSISAHTLICYADVETVITLSAGSDFPDLVAQITVEPLTFAWEAHALYGAEHSAITITHSILVHGVTVGATCKIVPSVPIHSGGYNLDDDDSCGLGAALGDQHADARLGPLQDNNTLDLAQGTPSGYVHTHALWPDSPAIDQVPPKRCGVGFHAIILGGAAVRNQSIAPGDIVQWSTSGASAFTVALHDGQSNVRLIPVAPGNAPQIQLTTPGAYTYQVYNDTSREIVSTGYITVVSGPAHSRLTDQRGTRVPQRGTGGIYHCDVGAYEFQPWSVGQAVPRPASAAGQTPRWYLGVGAEREMLDQHTPAYHAWSMAELQDLALRPSPNDGNGILANQEMVSIDWPINTDQLGQETMTQIGIVAWPDQPQIHVAGAPVNLTHAGVNDGYTVSKATPFKDRAPDPDVMVLSTGIFTRSTYPSGETAYTVLNFSQATQDSGALHVQVVKTVAWNTPGVRDMRPERSTCEIGIELRYGLPIDPDYHQDPEGKAGYIMVGDAYDGVRTTLDMARVQNTVDGLIPPAHNRETRAGPIIPILNTAPTDFSATPDPVTGGHDLRVAWYRPDARNVAWPVKTVGYRCTWPANPPEIVIASELGSEIGGQPVLSADYYQDLTVYHQPDPDEPGYKPNAEHALLATSNLGNPGPALYALRTDLSNQPYALLKYRDPREGDAGATAPPPKIGIYAVVLTRTAVAITNVEIANGTITLLAVGPLAPRPLAPRPLALSLPSLTLRIGDADLPPGGAATLAVEALGAHNLRAVTVTVQYDPAVIAPTACTPYRQDFSEDLYGLSIVTNAPRGIQPGRTVRLRANLQAGSDARYEWDFGDGVTRVAGAEVSHVYGLAGTYTVQVTAANGWFAAQSATTSVLVTDDENAIAGELAAPSGTGCRSSTSGKLTLVLQSRHKHGMSGNLLLADLSFTAVGAPAATTTDLSIAAYALRGPSYKALDFNLTAGHPVYAPVPMQGLLDLQPCSESQADAIANALPFWRDFKGQLWARAAGDMKMLYFYPLQAGFHLSDTHAVELGLVQLDNDGNPTTQPLPAAERVGRCVPWMDKLPQSTMSYADFPAAGATTHVLPVTYDVTWPAQPALLAVGATVYERATGGVSGVANQLAVSRIYDDVAPGQWDNAAGKIVLTDQEVQQSLVQLIDPLSEIRVSLPSPLPAAIKTERLLFGGGLAIIGNQNDLDLALPFSLRSRILYDDTNGELIFKGYYDGTSAAYIKGDPLLLLNVMSESDQSRLLALCPAGPAACTAYRDAITALYHKTRNPRQVDLDGDGVPDQDFLIGVQDANGDGIPEPYAGVGQGKALSAGNAAGVGYVTLVYNNDPVAGDLPVSLQVIQVGCTQNHLGEDSTYRGNVLVVQSDNFFDEKLTLRHTGDFGGRPDAFEFEWWLAPVDDTGVSPTQLPSSYPWQAWTRLEPGARALGPEITIEGANPTTLSDNWLIVRYKGYAVCGNTYRWSAFAGDPAAKPSEVRAQLAEGWIKRVTAGLNPFDTRVVDFVSAPINTNVDMVRQAGPRYEGPIAFNGDPNNLNTIGLIEAYQTVLERGRALSIDAHINHQGANAALLNVSTRIAALYMLLGNDAYMDALDPTVGLGTDSTLGTRAPSLFSFMNQFNASTFGLIDEELALLRGRDETLGGVAAAPNYNRLTWNFTNGDGEVAYVVNYNIQDYDQDGLLNEVDAAIMYPQGHGDAWGHQLTAIKTYYQLLRHPSYTWEPRAEPLAVGGAPLVTDYYDERRFVDAAVNKARVGADIVDLVYRKQYVDPDTALYIDPHVDASDGQRRAWGTADWAQRAGQGAYFDWVVANAIMPPIEERYTDVRKIDRTTVLELGAIVDQYAQIQSQMDQADNNMNPLGLAQAAVVFDLNPTLANSTPGGQGQTHFEQVYARAIASLGNAQLLFDYANAMKLAQREAEDEQRDFVTTIIEQDTAIINELIELFGYPYDADIGVNGTYPEGYAGPDIYNYDLWDRTELTDFQKRCDQNDQPENCAADTKTNIIKYQPMPCLGFFVENMDAGTVASGYDCGGTPGMDESPAVDPITLTIEYRIGTGLDKGRGRFRPDSWPAGSARAAPGEIQNTIQALYQARIEYEIAAIAYQNHVEGMQDMAASIHDRHEVLKAQNGLLEDHQATMNTLDTVILALSEIKLLIETIAEDVKVYAGYGADCLPTVFGFSNDVTSAAKCGIKFVAGVAAEVQMYGALVLDGVVMGLEFKKEVDTRELEVDLFQSEADFELRQMGREMADLIGTERELRLTVYLAKDQLNGAQGDFDQTLWRGFRKLAELIRLRKRWAGQISEKRYNDMAYRLFQDDALQKYRQQFDLAQMYTYLTAAAYDYETNLALTATANGNIFLRQVAVQRSLGEMQWLPGVGFTPIVGSGGLAGDMARMRDNFTVLKGQLGFNNPQYEANRFSLRRELLRLRDSSDDKWQNALNGYYVSNIYANNDVARLAKMPYGSSITEPGLVIPFNSSIIKGQNFFGKPLGPGDSAYGATQFTTKIAAVGVWFEGYDTERLAQTPRVYLLPAGDDVLRPRNTDNRLRYWNVAEQLLPLPYTLGEAEMADPSWIASQDGLDGQLFSRKPYADFRAYPYQADFVPDQMNTDTRLIGRSVWNTRWVLVIPGYNLLADSQQGTERFIEDVDDIYIYFQTYAYAGTKR